MSETEPTKPTKPVYGRGNCSAEEKERRRKEREAYEASLPPFEKKIENMLPFTYDELFEAMPRSASRCTKKIRKASSPPGMAIKPTS
ncbi:hypothetical protein [Paenibacillus macerans]|uniref:hypothetical protein n=1 Tax=Paenibacillus macerans TaxID=44252 RepID=UPI000690FE65|nr:hypothetical protein [Paenibacillus macerans]